MNEWLNTRQAAERLGVSEASVRRWSDQGILPVQRVGNRRERKFQTDHLDHFRAPARTASPGPNGRQSDVVAVTVGTVLIQTYTHLAVFYDTDERRLRLASPFLREGLLAGQPCLLAAFGPEAEIHLESLRGLGLDVDAAQQAGQLRVWSEPVATIAEGLRWWEDALWSALNTGTKVIRVVGETVSQRRRFGSEPDLLAYEAALNLVTSRFPCVVLCQYDVREFSGPALLTALRAHPDMLALPMRTLIS